MAEKKRLLITASTFPRFAGDTEPRFILDYAKAMAEFYDVTVFAPSFPDAEKKTVIEGINVEYYRYFPLKRLETLCAPGAIASRIKEKKARIFLVPFLFAGLYIKLAKNLKYFDIVHANWIIPQGIVQACFKKPYILTGHGGDVVSLNMKPLKALKKAALRKAGCVTVVSNFLKRYVRDNFGAEALVAPLGCDTKKFSPKFRDEALFGGTKTVLYVGRLVEGKGINYLIDAMKRVDAGLVIAGDGTAREKLEKQAAKLGNRVSFLGAKTHDELKTIYASADVFVLPSLSEGLGLVIIEAMASGVPVIACNSGGIGDALKDGENGLFIEKADPDDTAEKINMVLSDEKLADKLRKNGLNTAKQYDYSAVAKKYDGIIRNILEQQREVSEWRI